jgi:hypothetical protein
MLDNGTTRLTGYVMDSNESALQRSIFRDKAAKARHMDPGLKLTAGARLFDVARNRMIAGIRSAHPDWSDAEINAEFCRQLQVLRDREDRGVFTPVADR